MKVINFKPANAMEQLLASLPKKCSCRLCETSKQNVIHALGEKKFRELCTILKIYV